MEASVPGKVMGGVSEIRFPLSFYFRIADQLIKQVKVYKDEGNITDLYTTLNRYCRLSEVIIQHRSYSKYSAKEKLHHNKIYRQFVEEIEGLKPLLGCDSVSQNNYVVSSFLRPKVSCCGIPDMRSESFYDKNEQNIGFASSIMPKSNTSCTPRDLLCSTSSNSMDWNINVQTATQSSPSPVLSFIQSAPHAPIVSHVTVPDSRNEKSKSPFSKSKLLQDVHISKRLMEDFLELARDNTNMDLETCGVLGAFLKKGTFYVTTLIVPKQESTSSSCQAVNEEEMYAIQEERSLFPIGWIHTHPSQSCFMSSIDLHTHYPYQVMLPEAIAIVMAPNDTSRSHGIFRISDPGGITVLKECGERGFHLHQEPADGNPIYEHCPNVYINSNLRVEIFDLR